MYTIWWAHVSSRDLKKVLLEVYAKTNRKSTILNLICVFRVFLAIFRPRTLTVSSYSFHPIDFKVGQSHLNTCVMTRYQKILKKLKRVGMAGLKCVFVCNSYGPESGIKFIKEENVVLFTPLYCLTYMWILLT